VPTDDAESDGRSDDAESDGLLDSYRDLVVGIARSFEVRAGIVRVDLGLTRGELLEEGTAGLVLAVERFDPRQGPTFPTYATWWIRQAIFRGVMQVRDVDDVGSASGPRSRLEQFGPLPEFRDDVDRLLELLDERERALLVLRFGLGRDGRQGTLDEVGRQFGWTRERARQIEARSLSKIRHFELSHLNRAADLLGPE